MSIFFSLFAGLGLFFIGVRLISINLRQVIGRRLRVMIARAVTGRASLALFGLLAGAVMQSVAAVIHVLVALVSANAMQLRQAFPIVRWANLGTALLVLVAAIDLHALALCLVGLSGLAYYHQLDQSGRWRHAVGALLGLGLLFLGTDFIKTGSALLKTAPWLREQIAALSGWLLPSFVLGAAVAWLAQSSTTLVVIACSMAAGGLIGDEGGTMLVLGAGLGSGLASYSTATQLQGSARQLVLFQLVLRVQGLVLMLLLYALNRWLLGDPLGQLADRLGLAHSGRLVLVYLLVQAVSDLASRLTQGRIERWLQRQAPPSEAEHWARPRYLYDEAIEEPETALLLVNKEQQRLLMQLPHYLDALRADAEAPATPAPAIAQRQAAEGEILRRAEQFLTELADRHRSRELLERCMVLRDRNRLLLALQESLVELHQAAALAGEELALQLDQLVQSLHLMLLSLAEASGPQDTEELAMLRMLTHDRSEQMDAMRRRLLAGELSADAQQAVFGATAVFERCVWLLRRYVLLLQAGQPFVRDEKAALLETQPVVWRPSP